MRISDWSSDVCSSDLDDERRERGIDRADVEGERGPAVLARGFQPVVELDRRGLGVGFAARTAADLDQPVRLFRACGEKAARTVVLEGTADEAHAVGDQGGGERVAAVALIGFPVEAEEEDRK